VDLDQVKTMIGELEFHDHGQVAKQMGVTGFAAYLCSPKYNSPMNAVHEKTIYQDMTQPFPHYFIASSHNTYLLGDQLKGESSVQAYINALLKGCRCVELDCWDAPDTNEPIIYHGHTLTSKITFRSVIETIRDYGFKVSEYPVILSLEVHCHLEGQTAMANIVRSVLGPAGMLADQPATTGVFPPPEQLKNKVLLKGKMLSASQQQEEEEEEEDEEDEDEDEDEDDKKLKKSKDGKEEPQNKKSGEKKKKEKVKLSKELSDLITLKSSHFKNWDHSKENAKQWEICSFSEKKANKFIKKSPAEYTEFNAKTLSRIYPKGTRFDSSNYDPMPSWTAGAQVVALNYQTGSEPMWVNDGKFLDNGRSGYILKPKEMRGDSITWNPNSKMSVRSTLQVSVISGWQLPKAEGKETKDKGEVIDPYVKLTIEGLHADKKSSKTKTIKNNGFNPVWNADFKFPLVNSELAVLLFVVSDADFVTSDDMIGQYAMPVRCIREGYRCLDLKDRRGKVYEKASLLVQFKWI